MGSRLEANSTSVRKRIENHTFDDEDGEEYKASSFGGFPDYFRRKKIKLQNLDAELRSQSTDNPPIFRGVVAHVNGYTQPSLNDIHHLIVSHGGGFLQYLDGKTMVTHVIASSLTPKKKVEFAKYRIVKPAWVVDSVKAGKLLPWDAYRVVDEGLGQKVLGFENGQIMSQKSAQRQGYREQSETSWYASQVTGAAGKANAHLGSPIFQSAELEAILKDDEPLEEEVLSSDIVRQHPSHVSEAGFEPQSGSNALSVLSSSDAVNDSSKVSAETVDESPHSVTPKLKERDTPNVVLIPKAPEEREKVIEAAKHKRLLADVGSPEKRALTAEEHNAVLLSDPHMAKSSTANPDFLNQYYRESRLHHLSMWKANLKTQLQARAREKTISPKTKRIAGRRRYIMHVDFDSFFAAVSLRNNPHLIDKPVVVAHGAGPGSEIASCNYPARKFGIKNGMWMRYALELCPEVKVLPYDFKAYEDASRHFYEAILATDGIVQSVSIDEALVDISGQCIEAGGSNGQALSEGTLHREQAKACEIAENLRALIKDKTGCEVSIGLGSNILLAKVALRKAKPAGQYLIKPEEVLDYIGELTVTSLPGVAYSLGGKLEDMGVKLVKDIRALTKERLIGCLGPKTGERLWEYSRGIDNAEVGEQVIRKSVSAEVNWGIRFVTQQQAEEFVHCLCEELSRRLLEQTVKGKQMTMKIMKRAADAPLDPPKNLGHGKCDTFNKSIALGVATNDKDTIGREALSVLRSFGFPPGELRGLGVQMTKLEPLKPIATASSGMVDSSQRRLQFRKPDQLLKSDAAPALFDEADNRQPTKQIHSDMTPFTEIVQGSRDSIEEEVPTPEKGSKTTLTGAFPICLEDNVDSKHKMLNITGTQFVLPSQVDSSVLAELPPDIRSRLGPKQKSIIDTITRPLPPHLPAVPESCSSLPDIIQPDPGLPRQSQIDPEIFNALPDDVKDELRAHYENVQLRANAAAKGQQFLPQSPRKPLNQTKRGPTTPSLNKKVSSLATRSRSRKGAASTSTLTQSNFVALQNAKGSSDNGSEGEDCGHEVSQSFLAELPEEIRAEIMEEQRRNRLKTKAGLQLGAKKKRPNLIDTSVEETVAGQRKLKLSAVPVRPTFTSRKLSTLPELREAMSAWVDEFSGQAEEGPYAEDVDALVSYLDKVIRIELDLDKAVSVVEWLVFVLEDTVIPSEQARQSWQSVLKSIKRGVQTAVHHRELPPVSFDES